MSSREDIVSFCRDFERVGDELEAVIVGFQPTPDDSLEDLTRDLRTTLTRFSELQEQRQALVVPDELADAVAAVVDALDLQETGYRGSIAAIEADNLEELATYSATLVEAANRLNEASMRYLAAVEVVTGVRRRADG